MHIMKKIGLAFSALVIMLVPGMSFAEGMGDKVVVSVFRKLWNDVFGPSLIPDEKYWYLYLGAMACIYCFFAFFPKRIAGKELQIKHLLARLGQVAAVLLVLFVLLPTAIWLVYGLVKGFVLGAVSSTLSFLPDFLISAIVWVVSIVINFLVLIALLKAATSMGTYQSVWGAAKAIVAKLTPNEKNQGVLAIFGMILIHACLARIAFHSGIVWPIITVSVLGIVVTVYHFAFEQKVRDAVAVKETGLTEDGKVLCPNYFPVYKSDGKTPKLDLRGKPKYVRCTGRNDPKDKTCNECGGPLGYISWDCVCGKKDIPAKRKRCTECGFERPELENPKHTHSIPPQVRDAVRKTAGKDKKVCPHCGTKNRPEFNFCMNCKKQIGNDFDKPSDLPKSPKRPAPKTTSDSEPPPQTPKRRRLKRKADRKLRR